MSEEKKTVSVEVPLSVVAEHFLGLPGSHYGHDYRISYAVPHLGKDERQPAYYTLEIMNRHVNNELHLAFRLMKNGEMLREVVLSLTQIFDQAKRLDELLTAIQRDRNERGA